MFVNVYLTGPSTIKLFDYKYTGWLKQIRHFEEKKNQEM